LTADTSVFTANGSGNGAGNIGSIELTAAGDITIGSGATGASVTASSPTPGMVAQYQSQALPEPLFFLEAL